MPNPLPSLHPEKYKITKKNMKRQNSNESRFLKAKKRMNTVDFFLFV